LNADVGARLVSRDTTEDWISFSDLRDHRGLQGQGAGGRGRGWGQGAWSREQERGGSNTQGAGRRDERTTLFFPSSCFTSPPASTTSDQSAIMLARWDFGVKFKCEGKAANSMLNTKSPMPDIFTGSIWLQGYIYHKKPENHEKR
jgi:hypothetical protein